MVINSPLGKLFIAIMERIEAEVPEILYIDQDFGQLDGYVTRPGVAFPAAFIDFQNWTYKDTSGGRQMGQGSVVISVAYARHGNTNNITPKQWREIPLEYYEIEHKLVTKIQGWRAGDIYGPMSRVADRGQNGPAIRRRPVTFQATYEDDGAQQSVTFIAKPPPNISKTIEGTEQ
jgi:hypothetical protein